MTAIPSDSSPDRPGAGTKKSLFTPLEEPLFRRVWVASIFTSLAHLILIVGAGWEMLHLSDSPTMVGLVQTATMLPMMLVALPAGAMADMYNRRKVAIVGLGFAIAAASFLTALSVTGGLSPWLLLLCCFLVGTGVALFSPSWQTSIGEQVSKELVPAAVGLSAVMSNVARSFGPAIGALICALFGAQVNFGITALFFVPLFLVFYAWQHRASASRLPPERIDRAMASGLRFARHSLPIRAVMTRTFMLAAGSASINALAPLIAKKILGGDTQVFSAILFAQGFGAVLGAFFITDIRARYSTETVLRICAGFMAIAIGVISLSHMVWLTCLALLVNGACTILSFAQLNVSVQMNAPRWVTARAVSLYSSSLTGGVAFGGFVWGSFAKTYDVPTALMFSSIAVATTIILGLAMPLSKIGGNNTEEVEIGSEPEVALGVTLRSGPVVIEVEYDVDPTHARDFYDVMIRLGKARQRIGAFNWSVSRDIANPAIWVERYLCPTWGDYLRMRNRYTQTEYESQEHADAMCRHGADRHVRRMLERPYGSVRWKADTPDPYSGTIDFIGP